MPYKNTPRIDERRIRHDWRMWIRPDIARWMKPGVDPADVIPALARERARKEAAIQRARAAEDAELAAFIAHERRVWAALREEMKEVNAEMARWRRRVAEDEAKYSPDQPRVPKRNPGGGQWTRLGGGGQSPSAGIAQPMGNIDVGNLSGSSETEGLFNIAPAGTQDTDALTQFADNGSTPQPIPNANPDDANDLQDVNARRGGTSNWFPGASAEQQFRLDQAIARSENALTQIRQYDPQWQPREQSLTSPGSVEGAIARLEARATETETRLDQLRTGIGGNQGPALDPVPRGAPLSPRVFDGGAWIDAYRTINNMPDLFGRADWQQDKGTVAVGKVDGQVYFGVNSGAPGYSGTDWNSAKTARDDLIDKYPDTMKKTDVGRVPNDALFHAESTILLRAARDSGGSLANKSIEIQVDREVCYSCGEVLPKLSLELGDPYVVYVERDTGLRHEMWNGKWLSGRWK
jgi:hypothetical protein